MTKQTLTKSGRMLLLYLLRDEIEGLTLQQLADALGGVHRSTILRDLEEIEKVESEYQRLMAVQPWVQREFTTAEFAEEIGASAEAVRIMIRDGLIEARKDDNGHWYIPRTEVERFR